MTTKITRLANGLRIVTDRIEDVKTVSLGVWVGVGARYENKENNGIAHVLEHMAFKGTKTRTAKQLSDMIEDVGGRMNAYTSKEITCYYVKMLSEHRHLGLSFLADILQNSVFPKEELEKEKGVIIQEINMNLDQPDDLVFDYFYDTAFKKQPMGMTILGTEKNIKSMTPEKLFGYMKDGYAFEKMVISAAGDVSHAAFVKEVEGLFKKFQKKQKATFEKGVYGGGNKIVHKKLEQTNIVYGLPGISYFDEDYEVAKIFNAILGGGMSSRLFQEMREKRGLCYAVQSFNLMQTDCGIFGIYTGTGPKTAKEALKVMKEELEKMTGKIEKEELLRAKAMAKAGLLMSKESSSSRAETNAKQLLLFDKLIPAEKMVREIEKIDVKAINRFGKRILSGLPTLAVLGPEEQGI